MLPNWTFIEPSSELFEPKSIGLCKALRTGISNLKISKLYSMQVISLFAAARLPLPSSEKITTSSSQTLVFNDICIASPTGSGKTLAFGLAIYERIKLLRGAFVKALIVVPTRDLALQISSVLETLYTPSHLSVVTLVGQRSFANELIAITRADVVVATPGRLVDHLMTSSVDFSRLSVLVFDEVDRLFSDSFQDLINVLKLKINAQNLNILKIFASATLKFSSENSISGLLLNNPLLITSNSTVNKFSIPETLHDTSSFVVSPLSHKPLFCKILLQQYLPVQNDDVSNQILIFCNSCDSAHRLCRFLQISMPNFKISEFSSNFSQIKRNITLENFRNSKISVLICSDSISRGLDFPSVFAVISYDCPLTVVTLVHRIGRTGRANKSGNTITILTSTQVSRYKRMLHSLSTGLVKQQKIDPSLIALEEGKYQNDLIVLKKVLTHDELHPEIYANIQDIV
ncbi:hypothetical protein RCL1_005053 [Eukaryota sp. TZLM3-RCL]